jgi:hypothetical protein
MSSAEPVAPKKSSNARRIIVIVIAALLVVCVVIPICLIGLLAIMGPQISNVFSSVTSGLNATP